MCPVCSYEYDEDSEGHQWDELPADWACPVCGVEKSMFEKNESEQEGASGNDLEDYLKKWQKKTDINESRLAEIHQMAVSAQSIVEPMGSVKKVVSWDDLIIKGAQLAKIPLDEDVEVETRTIIGKNAKQPMVLETPVFVSHMSFGALSKEFKIALAKGSAMAKTAICSGEGGILSEEMQNAYKYIFEYVPNQYSLTDENLAEADAIEIKIGQAAKPGMGGHLPGSKVSDEIATVRKREVGKDIHSPASYKDIRNREELKAKVDWLREKSGGRPIGVKIAAGNIEEDMEIVLFADPDFITIDGRNGGTGSAMKYIKDSTSVPTLFALYRAAEFLKNKQRSDIALIITGGLRISSDFAKALALGADAVAIATAAMIAGGCQQYRICNTGNCPVGIATQDPELRKRIDIDKSALRLANYLNVCTDELKDFARITANKTVHALSLYDLCTSNAEISAHTNIKHI